MLPPTSNSSTGNLVVPVTATGAAVNTAAPLISGSPVVGDTLSCSTGTWSGVDTATLTYQWLRDGAAIGGATSASYTLTSADQGHSLTCQVTAANGVGSPVSATSSAWW